MPLAGVEGAVARLGEPLGEQRALGRHVAGTVEVEQRPPGVEHRPGGHADGAVLRAHVVGAGERTARLDQPVEVRRCDVGPERADRVEALVVGRDDEHVGSPRVAHAPSMEEGR